VAIFKGFLDRDIIPSIPNLKDLANVYFTSPAKRGSLLNFTAVWGKPTHALKPLI